VPAIVAVAVAVSISITITIAATATATIVVIISVLVATAIAALPLVVANRTTHASHRRDVGLIRRDTGACRVADDRRIGPAGEDTRTEDGCGEHGEKQKRSHIRHPLFCRHIVGDSGLRCFRRIR
jgi:hypothetical protein